MKCAIMQPYFLPYIGYFQLIHSVDKFIIYDNIKYTKKGWINRNRYLQCGKDAEFTLPLKKDSDFLDVRDRVISTDFNKMKLLNKISEAYRKAPYFNQVELLFERILLNNETNLFKYIYFSVKEICNVLKIHTEIVISSELDIDHSLKAQDKVIAICQHCGADVYINAIGGMELYSKDIFNQNGIELKFIRTGDVYYRQFENEFIPWLSILDVLMFNTIDEIMTLLNCYEIVEPT
jgi:hypothetical protein